MIDHERFAEEPADSGTILEERIHPWVRMWIRRRSGAVNGIATGAGAHEHDRHPVRQTAINGLEVFVIEGILPHDRDNGFDEDLVGDRAESSNLLVGVLFIFAAEAHDD